MTAMRQGLKGQNGDGWRVHEVRGRAFLTVHFDDSKRATLQLDLPWAGDSQAELLKVYAELKRRMTERHTTTRLPILEENAQALPFGHRSIDRIGFPLEMSHCIRDVNTQN